MNKLPPLAHDCIAFLVINYLPKYEVIYFSGFVPTRCNRAGAGVPHDANLNPQVYLLRSYKFEL
jgi:hypothetical protein